MKRAGVSWLGLLIVTAIALYLCWLIVQPFVAVILWATVLAIIAHPYYLRWRRRGYGQASAAAITTLVVVLVVLVPLSLLALALVRQAVPAAEALQRGLRMLLDPTSQWFIFINQYVDLEQLRDPEFIREHVSATAGIVAARTLGLLGGALGAVVQILFVLFTLFYLLRDADRIVPAVLGLLPLEKDEADDVVNRTLEVIHASIFGVVVIAAIQGLLGGLAFWVLGIPSPVLWGVVMFLLSLIPLAGPFLVWMPAALFLLFTGHWIKALLLTIWGAGIIGTIDNVLRPRLVGERAKLHELVVFFSVLGGLSVFGVLGLVVGPVVVAITMSLIDVVRRVNRRNLQADTPPASSAAPIVVSVPVAPPAPDPGKETSSCPPA